MCPCFVAELHLRDVNAGRRVSLEPVLEEVYRVWIALDVAHHLPRGCVGHPPVKSELVSLLLDVAAEALVSHISGDEKVDAQHDVVTLRVEREEGFGGRGGTVLLHGSGL